MPISKLRSRLGSYVSSSISGETVRAFIPPPLPPELDLGGLHQLLERASHGLGRLDGITSYGLSTQTRREQCQKVGGKAEDYLPIHNWFDESKAFFTDFPTEPYAPAAPNMTTSGCGIRPLCWPLSALLFYPLTTLRLAICFTKMKIWALLPLLLNYGVHACLELSPCR